MQAFLCADIEIAQKGNMWQIYKYLCFSLSKSLGCGEAPGSGSYIDCVKKQLQLSFGIVLLGNSISTALFLSAAPFKSCIFSKHAEAPHVSEIIESSGGRKSLSSL